MFNKKLITIFILVILLFISIAYAMHDTNAELRTYLKSLNWDAGSTPLEVVDVHIPQNFDAVYKNYNALQREVGFDLTPYCGKVVKRHTYLVNDGMRANILIYKGKIIGGDIMRVELAGYMLPLSKRVD